MSTPTPLLIDCDPGVDDALALALAVASPEVDLLGVTSVAGNGPLEVTTENALRLMHAFGRSDVPVAAGADRALVRTVDHGLPSPHGHNGTGGVEVPAAPYPVQKEHAVSLLARRLRDAEPHSVTIAAIGPLTNIALLLAMYPELTGRIARLVVMAGSMGRGNITPVAEFNVWTDPEAAHRVLSDSGLEVCVVGLDVTRRATVDEEMLRELGARSGAGRLLADMLHGYADYGPQGWAMHDALAIAAVIDPALIRTRPARIDVDTGVGPGRGQTICGLDGPYAPYASSTAGHRREPTRAHVAVDVDVEGFRKLVLGRVALT